MGTNFATLFGNDGCLDKKFKCLTVNIVVKTTTNKRCSHCRNLQPSITEFSRVEFKVQEFSTYETETYQEFSKALIRVKENGYETREDCIEEMVHCLFGMTNQKDRHVIHVFSTKADSGTEEQHKLQVPCKENKDYVAILVVDNNFVVVGPTVEKANFQLCREAIELVGKNGFKIREPFIEQLVDSMKLPNKIVMILSKKK